MPARASTCSRIQGLDQADAAQRLARLGPNALPDAPPTSVRERLLRQFQSPLIYILLFALGVDLALWSYEGAHGVPFESVAIALILVLNAGLGTYQEARPMRRLRRLKAMATPYVWVKRDGLLVQVPSRDLVPEDLVRIEAGDRIPADGTLLSDGEVLADEFDPHR